MWVTYKWTDFGNWFFYLNLHAPIAIVNRWPWKREQNFYIFQNFYSNNWGKEKEKMGGSSGLGCLCLLICSSDGALGLEHILTFCCFSSPPLALGLPSQWPLTDVAYLSPLPISGAISYCLCLSHCTSSAYRSGQLDTLILCGLSG